MNKLTPSMLNAERGLVSKANDDRFIIQLSEKWALGYDELQWIIYRWRGKAKGWRPMFFIASYKRVLMHVIEERGVER